MRQEDGCAVDGGVERKASEENGCGGGIILEVELLERIAGRDAMLRYKTDRWKDMPLRLTHLISKLGLRDIEIEGGGRDR